MFFVVRAGQSTQIEDLGGKASVLDALERAGLPVPPWICLTPAAFDVSLTEAQRSTLISEGIWGGAVGDDALADLRPRGEAREALEQALGELCPGGEPVAVRSSAIDEDGGQHAFAGQLESVLFVAPAEVAERVAEVWRSAFGERVLTYRRELGLPPVPSAPAVLIQRMVDADVSGVAFSADPVVGRRGLAVVSALYGLGTALVSGECDADTFHVARDGSIVERVIVEKRIAHRRAPNGSGVLPVPVGAELARRPALTDEQVRAVAELARRCEDHQGRPQDIEWAIQGGHLYLLQARPITTLARLGDPDGAYALWDNSNIAESYAGVTTPLTFSFARHAYEEVYRQLCRILGVPEATIEQHSETFRHMIGLVRGRVYYNLLNWYRLLALAPGFASNRRFMEQMMGVKEGLPESIAAELGRASWGRRLGDRLRLVVTVLRLAVSLQGLSRRSERFYQRIERALATGGDLRRMRPDELVAHYRALEGRLLSHWDAPLINDLFAMMFYGTLRTLTSAWCGSGAGSLQNDLLSGTAAGGPASGKSGRQRRKRIGMISAEPAARVRAMAQLAAQDATLVDALTGGSLVDIRRAMVRAPQFDEAYQAYLALFADRCMEELKLESPTLRDDPMPLLRAVGQLAQRFQAGSVAASAGGDARLRWEAEARARSALAGHPLRRAVFGWVLANARERVRDRENLRFERTRVFGRVRLIFVELGRRFFALDLLDDPRDVFYLEVEEALGFVTGTATCTDLKGLVAVRKAEFARFRAMEQPGERFETHGIVYHGNPFRGEAPVDGPMGDRRQGVGCCPGVVRGPVRIVADPRSASVQPGDILVAERTDPGWIMLFPSAAGVLVERGSVLSHSAIVARELGIPTVIALRGVTRWLREGDWVEVDGGTGAVTRLVGPLGEPGHG